MILMSSPSPQQAVPGQLSQTGLVLDKSLLGPLSGGVEVDPGENWMFCIPKKFIKGRPGLIDRSPSQVSWSPSSFWRQIVEIPPILGPQKGPGFSCRLCTEDDFKRQAARP